MLRVHFVRLFTSRVDEGRTCTSVFIILAIILVTVLLVTVIDLESERSHTFYLLMIQLFKFTESD